MDSNKRVVLAIALSTLVLVAFMFYQMKTAPQIPVETQNQTELLEEGLALDVSSLQQLTPKTNEVMTNLTKESVTFENDLVEATFENGSLKSYILKDFLGANVKGVKATNNVNLVEQVYNGIYPFTLAFQTVSNSMISDKNFVIITDNDIIYEIESKDDESVTFVTDGLIDGNWIRIRKSFGLTEKSYQLENSVSIENMSENDINLAYSYFLGTGIGPYRPKADTIAEDNTKVQYLREGKKTASKLLIGTSKKDEHIYKSYEKPMNWASLDNRYFTIISTLPTKNALLETLAFSNPDTNEYKNNYQLASFVLTHNIKKGQTVTDMIPVYAGPKSRVLFAKEYKEESYQSIFQESFLGLNLRPLTYILDLVLVKLFSFTKSYAWAIILFTFLFKLATFPLTQASYKSMKKMQLLNPKIERIRKQYKDDPQKMNAEVMSIYKKEKINPLGGCLPMLLPFPLLIAFFYLMQSMVELRNAPFLWITDLSSPDRLFIFAEAIPLIGGFNFNLLPIIMAATSYLSMKLQPSSSGSSGAAATQMKMMTTIFPLMMLFMFYNFASGLALYWTAQNVFGVLQQLITARIDKARGQDTATLIEEIESTKKKKKKKK